MSCQAIYPKEGNIIYMNSCGESTRKFAHCLKAVRWEIKNPHQVMVYKFYTNFSFFNKRGFMDTKGFKGATWKCVKLPHSLQPDATSCGVFVCKVSSCNNCFYNCITLVNLLIMFHKIFSKFSTINVSKRNMTWRFSQYLIFFAQFWKIYI